MLLESKHLAMLNCIKYVVFFMQHGFQPNVSTNVQTKKQKFFQQWWRNNWLCWKYFEIYCWASLLYLHKRYLSVIFTSDFPPYRMILEIYSVLKSNSNLHSTLRMDRKRDNFPCSYERLCKASKRYLEPLHEGTPL